MKMTAGIFFFKKRATKSARNEAYNAYMSRINKKKGTNSQQYSDLEQMTALKSSEA